jgi:hypothetical protein
VKTQKLGSAPITDTEYAELLGNIGKLSEKDRKALRARARAYELPAALSEAENALRTIFRKLFDRARMLAAKQIVPYTTDEQIAAEQDPIARFNDAAASTGWDVRLDQFGTANNGGLRIVELRPGAAEDAARRLRRGEWLSDIFAFLWLTAEGEPVHPAMFEAQATRHWDKRLRQRVAGKDFADLADSRDRTILEDERRRKDTMDRIDGTAAVWNAALDRQGERESSRQTGRCTGPNRVRFQYGNHTSCRLTLKGRSTIAAGP